MIAKEILELLRQKHSKDVFVTECKDGPTQMSGGHLRMDVWAMARSWAHPCVSAYEVKVSRRDFLADEKWHGYLDYCNRFSFVCPHGVVGPDELPENVGLLWVAKTGSRLFTKRKPVHREVEIPEAVYRYILMCRVDVRDSEFVNGPGRKSNQDYWRRWIESREVDFELGQRVGRALHKRIDEEVIAAREENERLQSRVARYDELRHMLTGLGFDPDKPPYDFMVRRRIEEAQEAIPQRQIGQMRGLAKGLSELADALEKINNDETLDAAA